MSINDSYTTITKAESEVIYRNVYSDVDYSKITVAELKEVAAKKKINVTGMKKAEIIEALTK